ncbi:cytochrome c oxidase assembly protein COX20, mitochondrial-like [Lineus longissimus]|uniref:cytochrome c oxidase assembly protein COX20, mitochondrial-like n=1 Tax=Lineus longissimus TaxID=88925 RepID=UPI002B4E4DA3
MPDGLDDDDSQLKSLKLFGLDYGKVPCMKQSLLTGIGSGLGIGIVSFLMTSNPRRATNYGFGSYIAITMGTWIYCRYRWSQQRFQARMLKKGIENKLLYEGTEFEKQFEKDSEEV